MTPLQKSPSPSDLPYGHPPHSTDTVWNVATPTVQLANTGAGMGIYSVPEAARLTGVTPTRISGWLRGYPKRSHKQPSPALHRDFETIDGVQQLSFLDLVEIRVVDRLLSTGITWPELRAAAAAASEILNTPHPFATKQMKTDGKALFAEIGSRLDQEIIHLSKRQHVIVKFIQPSLKGIEFEQDMARRWWPLVNNQTVVIDPTRSFGRPITQSSGVPTQVLAAYAAQSSPAEAARWYETDIKEVRGAVRFEHSLAA